VNNFDYLLSIPGEVQIVETGDTVSAVLAGPGIRLTPDSTTANVGSGFSRSGAVDWVAVPFDKTRGGLQVRNRRPGDRFRPLGAPGRKKLQDFLVDRKVVREQRDRIPIVVDAEDRIVWVAGLAVDEAFRVKDPAQAVIILRLNGVGGSS
jgi:tRNA(Ile)-lysidine synthase